MIPFHVPTITGHESSALLSALASGKLAGDGPWTRRCHEWFEKKLGATRVFLTTSCTHALELAALMLDLEAGDEVIMPSFTFVSTANAFALRGAQIVFVDIDPATMNMSAKAVASAVTARTKAIVPVHYAGVACDMDELNEIAAGAGALVIEDAAHGVTSTYRGRPLGCIGALGCYSFHDTKNLTCGEGGLLIVNDARFADRAEIIREKGTNRANFLRGMVDKYTWIEIGSSYLPSELNAAVLCSQLDCVEQIQNDRMSTWNRYRDGLRPLAYSGRIELPFVPGDRTHNAHLFFIKAKDLNERTLLMNHLRERGVSSAFHYVPLHSSPRGTRLGRFCGEDRWTTRESERLLRLPFWYGLPSTDVEHVIDCVFDFYGERR